MCPSSRSIVLSSNLTKEHVIGFFRAQARGVLASDLTDFATLCKCITCVHKGQIWANSEQLGYLIESLSGSKALRIVDSRGEAILSAREEEVLHLLAEGLTNREMAASLHLSEHTIKNHLFHIFDKLGVSSRTEAILYAMSRRMVTR
ncbi:MAG TPA: response regulator transcription factor [Pseudacidobacterium sp.]|nr:response regulator transcription factor [Pseudacidobacterium sp.]